MNAHQFDDLTRLLARGGSRRDMLKVVGALLVAGLAGMLGMEPAHAKEKQCRHDRHCARPRGGTGGICCEGVCCPSPEYNCCHGVCTDIHDPNNCGQCGNVCPAGTTCPFGSCI
jgi:hypothetical protein